MFANAGVPWPSPILQLFNILSAFNLNIQIVAPECLIPSVSFSQKFAFIVMLPAVLGFFFVLLHGFSVAYKACILGRRKNLQRNLSGLVSSFLLLFYVVREEHQHKNPTDVAHLHFFLFSAAIPLPDDDHA